MSLQASSRSARAPASAAAALTGPREAAAALLLVRGSWSNADIVPFLAVVVVVVAAVGKGTARAPAAQAGNAYSGSASARIAH